MRCGARRRPAPSEYNPLTFDVRGPGLPGHGRTWARRARQGAVRIMTGAPMPRRRGCGGACRVRDSSATGAVEIASPLAPASTSGRRAEDVREGAVLLGRGHRLRAQDVGLIASVGIDRRAVVRRPRVRIIVTGDELVDPGAPKGPYQIYDANSACCAAWSRAMGRCLEPVVRVADRRDAIHEAMLAQGADVVLVSGGSSVGAEDHAPGLLAEAGKLAVHGIAMRPSSPAGFGRIGATLVFLLPGNPVSCLCAYDFFAGRALRRLGGRPAGWPHRMRTRRARSARSPPPSDASITAGCVCGRRGRTARAERRVDSVFDDARRRLRHRAGRKRRLCGGKRTAVYLTILSLRHP